MFHVFLEHPFVMCMPCGVSEQAGRVFPLGARARLSWSAAGDPGEPEACGSSLGPGWLLHLVMFLGKKLRSSPWSQRRTERDRRELLGGCGYTTYFLVFFRAGTAGGKEGEAGLHGAAAGSGELSSAWPAAAMALSEFLWQRACCAWVGAGVGRWASRGGASVWTLNLQQWLPWTFGKFSEV